MSKLEALSGHAERVQNIGREYAEDRIDDRADERADRALEAADDGDHQNVDDLRNAGGARHDLGILPDEQDAADGGDHARERSRPRCDGQ